MSMVYEASVFETEIMYKNFKGEEKKATLYFALDPMQLMEVISGYSPKKIKSGNPALNGTEADMTEQEQIKLIRGLAAQAAGMPSDDGERWLPFENFQESISGKSFMLRLASSDETRRIFAEKVLLDPFRAYVNFARVDPANSPGDIKEFDDMLSKMERVFTVPDIKNESAEDRRARLQAELASLPDSE